MPEENVIIIGGGPSGVACAVQLKRYGIDPLIIEKDEIGGLVKNAWRLDNYPGYPEGISGIVFVNKLKAQLDRFEVRYQKNEIRNAKFINNIFILETTDEKISCDVLVIASGTRPKKSTCDNEFTEVFPLLDKKNKKIGIVGAGDAAFDYAMSLCEHNEVHIFNRGDKIKCVPALLKIAEKQENISYHENSMPVGSFDYTIFATGREPDLSCLSEELKNKQDQLEHDGLLYVIGDVKNGMVRQTSVAAGDGIRAAMAIKDRIICDEGNQQDTGT